MSKRLTIFAFFLFLPLFPSFLFAQGGPPVKMPPAAVVVSDVSAGFVAPEAEFVGTVFYLEVSEVAAEVNEESKKSTSRRVTGSRPERSWSLNADLPKTPGTKLKNKPCRA
jgi:hypothetical protein